MADEEVQSEAEAPDVQPEGRSSPLLAYAGLAGGLAVGALVGLLLVAPAIRPAGAAAEVEVEVEEGGHGESAEGGHGAEEGTPMHVVENLVLNPLGTNGSRFLMVSVAVELSDAALADELVRRDAEVRDRLMMVLGQKTVDELSRVELRDSLKAELKGSLVGVVAAKEMKRIYLPTFVIQ